MTTAPMQPNAARIVEEIDGLFAGFDIEADYEADGDDPEEFMRAATSVIYKNWPVIKRALDAAKRAQP